MTRDEKIQVIDASYHAGESLQVIMSKVGTDDDTLRLIHSRVGTAMSTLLRMRDDEQATQAYREARDAYLAKTQASDDAFARFFNKAQRGEKTSGSATRRLENEANALSIVRYNAEGELYKRDIDPDSIDRADGITDSSWRYSGGGYS